MNLFFLLNTIEDIVKNVIEDIMKYTIEDIMMKLTGLEDE